MLYLFPLGRQHQRIQWCYWSETVSYCLITMCSLIVTICSVRHMQLPPLDAAQLEKSPELLRSNTVNSVLRLHCMHCTQKLCHEAYSSCIVYLSFGLIIAHLICAETGNTGNILLLLGFACTWLKSQHYC